MRNLAAFVSVSLALVAGLARAELQWDGYTEVPAVLDRAHIGKWLTCTPGSRFMTDKLNQVDSEWCFSGTWLPERAGRPRVVSVQELLDLHAIAPAGYRLVAVGPLPVYNRTRGEDPMTRLIAYKLEPMKK